MNGMPLQAQIRAIHTALESHIDLHLTPNKAYLVKGNRIFEISLRAALIAIGLDEYVI